MAEFASKGVAGSGLGLGIAGTALGVLNGGLGNLLGGVLGNGCNNGWHNGCNGGYAVPFCSENMPVNRYETAKDAKIAELETEIKLRDANTFTMGEMGKLRDYMERRFDHVEHKLCEQAVYNTANTSALNCMGQQIAALSGLTKLVIPKDSICPEVMPRYNSWVAPAAADTSTATG